MAKYTTEVRTICESELGLIDHVGFNDMNDMIKKSAPLVFNFSFPMYDEAYRLTLECKILKHFYFREIASETVGQWKLWLDERLNLIMPYYNELYKTTLYKFNPMYDVDLTTDHDGGSKKQGVNFSQDQRDNDRRNLRVNNSQRNDNGERTKNGEVNSDGTSHSVDVEHDINRYSDTPQGSITDLAKDKYLTNATINDTTRTNDTDTHRHDNTKETDKNTFDSRENALEQNSGKENERINRMSHDNIDTTEKYVQRVFGANGNRTLVYKIVELRNAILNIDKMIIEELNDLFFGLWG